MNIENDGMRYPSIDQLATKTSSKYKLVIGAAIRAKQINKGDKALIDNPRSKKSIGIALEEVINDKIIIK
jgi:DNA-directed RNA polymerase subunit omega